MNIFGAGAVVVLIFVAIVSLTGIARLCRQKIRQRLLNDIEVSVRRNIDDHVAARRAKLPQLPAPPTTRCGGVWFQ